MKKSVFIVISALIMLGAFCSCGSEEKKVQTDDKVEVSGGKKSIWADIDENGHLDDDKFSDLLSGNYDLTELNKNGQTYLTCYAKSLNEDELTAAIRNTSLYYKDANGVMPIFLLFGEDRIYYSEKFQRNLRNQHNFVQNELDSNGRNLLFYLYSYPLLRSTVVKGIEKTHIAIDQVDNNKDFVLTYYLSRMLEEDLENYKENYYEYETESSRDQFFYQFGSPFFEVLNHENFKFPEDEEVMERFWQKLEEAAEKMDSRWEWVSKGCQRIYNNQIEKKNLKAEVPAFSKLRPADPENDRDLPLITCLYDDVTYERIPYTTVFPIEDLDGNVIDGYFEIKGVEPELYVQNDMVCQIYIVVTPSDEEQHRVSGRHIYLYSDSSLDCLNKDDYGSYYINYNKTVNYGKWLDSDMNGKVPCCNDEKIMEQEVGEMYLSHNFWENPNPPVKLYVDEKDKKFFQHDFRFELHSGGVFTVSARSDVKNSFTNGLTQYTEDSNCETVAFFELSGNKLSFIMSERILKPGENKDDYYNVFYDYEFSKTENCLQLELKVLVRSVFSDFVRRTNIWVDDYYYEEHYEDILKKTCSKIYTAPIPYCWNLKGNWIMFYESDEGDNFWL